MDARAIERRRERSGAIEAAVADGRAIENENGVTRGALEKMTQRLVRLAAHQDLRDARG
jgi:hypothetical protein